MALFILRILIPQSRMRSHPVGLDVRFLVRPFVYFLTSCVRTAKALARLRECAGSPESSQVAYVISTIISWAGSYVTKVLSLRPPRNHSHNFLVLMLSKFWVVCYKTYLSRQFCFSIWVFSRYRIITQKLTWDLRILWSLHYPNNAKSCKYGGSQ